MLDFRIFGNPMEVEKEEERDHALPCRRGESLEEKGGGGGGVYSEDRSDEEDRASLMQDEEEDASECCGWAY